MPKKHDKTPQIERLYTLAEAAVLAGINPCTARSGWERGEIPSIKTGGRVVLFEPEAVKTWANTPRKRGPKPRNTRNQVSQ